jgi:hypothetical protein
MPRSAALFFSLSEKFGLTPDQSVKRTVSTVPIVPMVRDKPEFQGEGFGTLAKLTISRETRV